MTEPRLSEFEAGIHKACEVVGVCIGHPSAPTAADYPDWREMARDYDEREAAAAEGLDVDRLDDAIAAFYGRRLPRTSAEGIAAAYARLAKASE